MSVRVGQVDLSWFPYEPPGTTLGAALRSEHAVMVEPPYTHREGLLAQEILEAATPLAARSARMLLEPVGRGRPRRRASVGVTTSNAWADAYGTAYPGPPNLEVVLPLVWAAVLREGPTTLGGGRHLVAHAADHEAHGRPRRVLALRVVPMPGAVGPADDVEQVFQFAWARLTWPVRDECDDDDDDEGAEGADGHAETVPESVVWDPLPTTLDELAHDRDEALP